MGAKSCFSLFSCRAVFAAERQQLTGLAQRAADAGRAAGDFYTYQTRSPKRGHQRQQCPRC